MSLRLEYTMTNQPTHAVLVHRDTAIDLGYYVLPSNLVHSKPALLISTPESPLGEALLHCPHCEVGFKLRLLSGDEMWAQTKQRLKAIAVLLISGMIGSLWAVLSLAGGGGWFALVVLPLSLSSLFFGLMLMMVKTSSYALSPDPSRQRPRFAVHVVQLQ